MAGFVLTQHVDAAPERVFDVCTDLANAPNRIRAITKMELLTPGPVGTGTRFRETRVLFKREASETMEITRFERPHAWDFTCESHGCRYLTQWRVHPKDEGRSSELELRFHAQPLGLGARLLSVMTWLMLRLCRKETAKDLEDMAAAAEARTPLADGASRAQA